MVKGVFEDRGPGVLLLYMFVMVLAGWFVFQLLALLSGALFFHVGLLSLPDFIADTGNPASIAFQKYVQAIVSLGMFMIAPLFAAYTFSHRPLSFLRADSFPTVWVSLMVVAIMLLALPLNNFLTHVNQQLELSSLPRMQAYFEQMEAEAEELFSRFLHVQGFGAFCVNILVIAVIPALGEEILFRGIMQKLFISWTKNVLVGILLTSFVFALLHFQFLSLLPRFFLGIILGYIFYRTSSLWMPILAHFVNNAVAVGYYHLLYNGKVDTLFEKIGTPGYETYYAAISLVLILALLGGIHFSGKKETIKTLQ